MTETDLILFGTLILAIIGLIIEVWKQQKASKDQASTIKAIMDYVAVQRDQLRLLESESRQNTELQHQALIVQREHLEWEKLVGLAKTVGWLLDKGEDNDEA